MASSTREKILAASLRLFNEQGYRNVTMRAIADALSISVGNLTYHFAKKQDIAAALMDDVFAQITATADLPVQSLAQIDHMFDMMLDTLCQYSFFFLDDDLRAMQTDSHHLHLRSRLIDGLNTLARQGFFVETFTPEVCRTLVQMLLMSHLSWMDLTLHDSSGLMMGRDEFMRAHWLVLGPYLTEKGRAAYRAMRQNTD